MKEHFAAFVALGIAVTVVAFIADTYVWYRYGCASSAVVCSAYSSLAVWLITFTATTLGGFVFRLSNPRLLSYVTASALTGPALLLCKSWWLESVQACGC
jgi:D-alanyl-lipoteichoic acid acyltransferase DltB (MBOAT superfamily)